MLNVFLFFYQIVVSKSFQICLTQIFLFILLFHFQCFRFILYFNYSMSIRNSFLCDNFIFQVSWSQPVWKRGIFRVLIYLFRWRPVIKRMFLCGSSKWVFQIVILSLIFNRDFVSFWTKGFLTRPVVGREKR